MKTTASWKANNWVDGTWTFAIDGQSTMIKVIEEPISVLRPDRKATQENALLTIQSADDRLANSVRRVPETTSRKAEAIKENGPNGANPCQA